MSPKYLNRRKFLSHIAKGAAAAASLTLANPFLSPLYAVTDALDPRTGLPNPFVNGSGQPLLVSVTGTNFELMLSTGLAVIGGLDLLVTNNQNVLIKPNVVTGDENYPTVSDPASIAALVTALSQMTSGSITVGDGPATPSVHIWEDLGYDPLIPNAGAELLLFDETYEVRHPSWSATVPDFNVYTDVYDAPLIINFPNIKRHNSASMTCAIKNHVGTVAGPDVSSTRGYLHNVSPFMETIADIASLINSELNIIDARTIMALNGPYQAWGGEPRPMDRIFLCGDMVAADAYSAQALAEIDETFDPSEIEPTLNQAVALGLGTADLTQVEIIEATTGLTKDPSAGSGLQRADLHGNYPDPFNPTTTIRFELKRDSQVHLSVHNLAGRKVADLINESRRAGIYEVPFNASHLSSGKYIYQLKANGQISSGLMTLVK